MIPKFSLGEKVIVSAVLEKQQRYFHSHQETSFEMKPISPVCGIYIGYRTAQTGITRYDEDGPSFKVSGKVTYFLVVTSPRKNPIKAYIAATL